MVEELRRLQEELPLGAAAIERAIELNAREVENNMQAFRWGRLAVADPGRGGHPLAQTTSTAHCSQTRMRHDTGTLGIS